MGIKKRTILPVQADNPAPSKPVPFFERAGDYVPKPKEPLPEPAVFGDMEPFGVRRSGYIIADADEADTLNVADMVIAMRTPMNPGEYAETKYRARVRNRGTAITAFCVSCMGGSRKDVTECESTGCALWAFRFGSDPFRGKR